MITLTWPSLGEIVAQPTGNDDGDELSHWFCCDPMIALCGAHLGGNEVDEDADPDCVVCLDMFEQPCAVTCDNQRRTEDVT